MLQDLLPKVEVLSKEVGAFILSEKASFKSEEIEVKSKNSLVSYVDKTAEESLVKGLADILPEAGFITEEETIEQSESKEFVWVIDPLDGTTNFMHGLPVFAISIALMQNGQPVLGVVYEINQNEVFSAYKNGGAFLNGESISVTQTDQLQNSLIATGFPYYDYNRIDPFLGVLKYFMHETRGVRRMGSAAVDLAYVSCGRFDAYFEYSLNAWDVAAGVILVQEAGGKVSDFKGKNDYLFGREIIAGNTNLFDSVFQQVKVLQR